ncbi:monomethylamine:corrinoid methyltransferase [Phosphitispora sp. TUW77]|uniref:monomethylamine:corrinoid methyltransferase n=1 Tax=Phosphitispora sp. TUW77 TaxID=3152361 RepID=UPI003AB8F575
MIPTLDFQERSLIGPVMKMDEFDLALAKKVRALVKKYEIKYNPEELLPDDATADAVFQAGCELLADIGILNIETSRVIQLTKEEIAQVCKEYSDNPPSVTFGRAEDAHTVVYRPEQDPRCPANWANAAGVIGEDWIIPYVQSWAQEPVIQGFGISGGIASVGGVVPKAGCPSEISCGIWEQQAVKEAVRRAGRPNIHLGLIPTVSTTGGTLAVIGSGLREPFNTQVGIHIIPEMKIDWTRFNLAVAIQQRGIEPWTSTMSLLGGLCGGPAGVAVGMMANFIGQLSYAHGRLGSFYVNDMTGRASHREALWSYAASFRAVNRNIKVITGTCCSDSGPVFSKEEPVVRGIAMAIVMTACGGGYTWAAGNSGITARLHKDVMTNVAPLSRDKVNVMLEAISKKLEEMDQPGGERLPWSELGFHTRYDISEYKGGPVKPQQKHIDDVKKGAEILASLGVPVSKDLELDPGIK